MNHTLRRPRHSFSQRCCRFAKMHGRRSDKSWCLFDKQKQFEAIKSASKFFFEKDFPEKYLETLTMIGIQDNGFFIDIGIPEDFKKPMWKLN